MAGAGSESMSTNNNALTTDAVTDSQEAVAAPDCLGGARAGVELVDGIALTDSHPVAALRLASADACLRACRNNAVLFSFFLVLYFVFDLKFKKYFICQLFYFWRDFINF